MREITADEKKAILDVPAGRVDDMGWRKGWPKLPSTIDRMSPSFRTLPTAKKSLAKVAE